MTVPPPPPGGVGHTPPIAAQGHAVATAKGAPCVQATVATGGQIGVTTINLVQVKWFLHVYGTLP